MKVSKNYAFARDAFRVWLRKNPNEKFNRCNSRKCPLATFAIAACGYDRAVVDNQFIELNRNKVYTKGWQAKFIDAVDDGKGRITGREAYRILNRISRGPNG